MLCTSIYISRYCCWSGRIMWHARPIKIDKGLPLQTSRVYKRIYDRIYVPWNKSVRPIRGPPKINDWARPWPIRSNKVTWIRTKRVFGLFVDRRGYTRFYVRKLNHGNNNRNYSVFRRPARDVLRRHGDRRRRTKANEPRFSDVACLSLFLFAALQRQREFNIFPESLVINQVVVSYGNFSPRDAVLIILIRFSRRRRIHLPNTMMTVSSAAAAAVTVIISA